MVTRVFLIDDHAMLTDTLSLRLSEVRDLVLVGRSGTNDADLLREVEDLRPDVITIDVEPLGATVPKRLAALGTAWPPARLVVLTGSHDSGLAVAAARAGAAAWVAKESSLEDLIEIIHGVRRGHSWYPPEHLGAILRALRADAQTRGDPNRMLDRLSVREFEVLLGIIDGLSYRQIAQVRAISVKTVQSHAVHIFAKLGVHSRTEASRIAARAGLRPADGGDAPPSLRRVRLVHRDESQGPSST